MSKSPADFLRDADVAFYGAPTVLRRDSKKTATRSLLQVGVKALQAGLVLVASVSIMSSSTAAEVSLDKTFPLAELIPQAESENVAMRPVGTAAHRSISDMLSVIRSKPDSVRMCSPAHGETASLRMPEEVAGREIAPLGEVTLCDPEPVVARPIAPR